MVDRDQWLKVRRLFHRVLDLPPGERTAFLEAREESEPRIVAEVQDLLRRHADPRTFLEGPLTHLPGAEPAARIGPYEIQEVLGRGGMGTVYLAVRVDGAYRNQVAIKVVHPELSDPHLEQRFRRERQILADLEHPSIARILDGGRTEDSRQYLVLEYVQGEPIDRHCDGQRLPIRRRLELFRQVCSAVHFAHQNLVVHRDLKPGNILVTPEGHLKLLDFGIAKLLGTYEGGGPAPMTGEAPAPMTPEFASPEQMQGKPITTACDVYALGNLLYLLLCGRRPFQLSERSPQEFVKAVCSEDPVAPSTLLQRARGEEASPDWGHRVGAERSTDALRLARALAGDLDNIVAKALQKDPRHRYLSAEELSLDVDRHLKGLPVAAREQTVGYRMRKFVRRHRWPVAAAAVVVLAFAAFTAALLLKQVQVLRERSHSQEVTRFLEGLFEISDPDRARGERVTARELLDRGTADIQNRLQDQPLLRASLLATMGRVYRKLGLYDEAAPLVREALTLRRQAHGGAHREVADSLLDLGEQLLSEGEYGPAQSRFEEGWAMLQGVGAAQGESGVRAVSGLSRAFQLQGDYDRAQGLRRQSLDLAIEVLGERHAMTAVNQSRLGDLLRERGQYGAAAQAYTQALELYRRLYGEVHPRVADLHNDLGQLYGEQGRFDEARRSFDGALEIQGRVYESDHPELASVRINLAALLLGQGFLEEAEDFARQGLESLREALGQSHPDVADSLNLLGLIRHHRGDLTTAEALFTEALEMWTELLGEDFVKVAAARNNLSQVLQDRGDLEGAQRQLIQALGIYRKTFGEEHIQVATVLSNLALVHKKKGDLKAARESYEESLRILGGLLGPEHPSVAKVSHNLAVLLDKLEEPEAAEERFRQALAALEASLPPDNVTLGVMRRNLARTLLAQGKAEEAREEVRRALTIFEGRQLAPGEGAMLAARGLLGEILVAQGEFEAAEEVLVGCLEAARQRQPGDPHLEKARERLAELYEAWGRSGER